VKHEGAINASLLHVMDITPTLLESDGVEHPARQDGSEVPPLQGRSMWPLLAGRQREIRTDTDWLGWDLFGNRAIRRGDWKLLYLRPAARGIGSCSISVGTPPSCTTFPRSTPPNEKPCSSCGTST
jgi:arylsulfatase A-like enzyme